MVLALALICWLSLYFFVWSQWNWDHGNCLKWEWRTLRRTRLISPRAFKKGLRTCTEYSKISQTKAFLWSSATWRSYRVWLFNINEDYRWERGLRHCCWQYLLCELVQKLIWEFASCNHLQIHVDIHFLQRRGICKVSFRRWLCY